MSSAASPLSGSPLRNILIGVITTVLGSAAVYYLGFHTTESPANSLSQMKKTTINGWDSYVSAENVFTTNWNILARGFTYEGFDHYKEATLGELDRLQSDFKKILDMKNLDPSLSSLLERRIQAKEQWEQKYKINLDNYQNILQTSPKEELTQRLNNEMGRFQNDVRDIDQLCANETNAVCETLTSKYESHLCL